jgi:hypothetical protein
MNGVRAIFASVTGTLVALLGSGALAAPTTTATSAPETIAAIAAARAKAPYPTFRSVPPRPTDVRPVKAWKAAVLATEARRDELTKMAAAEPWTLHDTESWAEQERQTANPPPPITTPSSEADTVAFAAALRVRATPPPRKR